MPLRSCEEALRPTAKSLERVTKPSKPNPHRRSSVNRYGRCAASRYVVGLVEPFLPAPHRRLKGGRPRVSDHARLTGILFVLRSGIPLQMLPQELGSGSGMTCWRRVRDWQQAGVWDLIHFALLDWLAR